MCMCRASLIFVRTNIRHGVRMCALGAAQAFRVSRGAKQANWTATLHFCICICVFVFVVFVMLCQTDKLDYNNTVFGKHILISVRERVDTLLFDPSILLE